jgi:putative phosphoribosyl transferase
VTRRYRDRRHAGEVLAERLVQLDRGPAPVVCALVRGGVPVGAPVAEALDAPLEPYLVRKLGVPGHEELAMGALAGDGTIVRNTDVLTRLGLSDDDIARAVEREQARLTQQLHTLRGDRPLPDLAGRWVVLVDDGLATGATMRAAVAAVRHNDPDRVTVAVPVGAPPTCELVAAEADELVCPLQPPGFTAVGAWYDRFDQVSDDEVRALLAAADAGGDPPPG